MFMGMGLPAGNPNRNHKDNGVPTGSVVFWASETFIPPGWVLLDGSTKNKDEFPDLFEYYANCGIVARSSSTFTLHEVRGRMPIFAGDGPSTTDRNVGDSSGAETVTIATANLPAHSHTMSSASTLRSGSGIFAGKITTTAAAANVDEVTGNTGSGTALNVMNPFFCFAGIQKT